LVRQWGSYLARWSGAPPPEPAQLRDWLDTAAVIWSLQESAQAG
jgi:hypothetical protein